MHYPFWDTGIGYGWLMAIISVFHVFISHFAIGGGLYLVLTEITARKRNDQERLEYLQRLSRFFVLTTVVMGAVTGVGIWFVIGLLAPAATEMLIHNFVWGWATEWTFFIIEIAAAIIYLYGWKRMSARSHLLVGWIYFVAAWLSLVIINGILAFMLTPGDWINTGSFWSGFFNPTYFSSVFFRTGVCVLMAGLFTLAVASRMKQSANKNSLMRYNAVWGLAGLVLMAPTFYWYWETIPETIRTTAESIMPTVIDSLNNTVWYALGLAVLLLFALALPRGYKLFVGVIALALGLLWFGQFEWMRESIRKPYVVYGYMYGNGLEVAKADELQTDGLLAHMPYQTGDKGRDLFGRACQSCHTIDGYKALSPFFDGTDPEFIAGMVRGTGVMVGNMPPWLGNEEESHLIAEYIWSQVDQRHLKDVYGLSGATLGKKVYEVRCGSCHVMGGNLDVSASIIGFEPQDIYDILDIAGEFAEEMPDFTGDEVEREALVEYLQSLEEGGADATAGL